MANIRPISNNILGDLFVPKRSMQAGYINPPEERAWIESLAAVEAVAYPVIGVDVSEYQVAMDWSITKKKAQFAWIRRGFGNTYRDPKANAFINGAAKVDIAWGGYWCPNPSGNWKTCSASWIKAYKESPGVMPEMVDIELDGGLNKTMLESWFKKCIDAFEQAIGKAVVAYTSAGFLNYHFPMTNWLKNRSLDVAHYTTAAQPWIPDEWSAIANPKTWTYWQDSATTDGASYGASSKYIDHQRYNGTVAQFNEAHGTHIVELGDVPQPPPVHTYPTLPRAIVTTSSLRVRTGPGTNFPQVENLYNGQIVDVISETTQTNPGSLRNIWLRIGYNQYVAYYYDGATYLSFL